MKLNKSIFSIVLLSIFVLSACSQARYGSHTRRIKQTKAMVKTETNAKRESILDVKIEGIVEDTLNNEVVLAPKAKEPTQNPHQEVQRESRKAGFFTMNTDFEPIDNLAAQSDRSSVEELVIKSKQLKKVLKKADFNEIKKVAEVDGEVDDLLYIILVVILVLLILSLISKLFPVLNWILGLAVLILLIYIVLQLL